MVGEALLFLVDIEFLDVVYHLLLEAVVAIVDFQAVEPVDNLLAYLVGALRLILFNLFEQGGDVMDFLFKLLLHGLALLTAESGEAMEGIANSLAHGLPLLIGGLGLCGLGLHHSRHAAQHAPPVLRLADTQFLARTLYLAHVGREGGRIEH